MNVIRSLSREASSAKSEPSRYTRLWRLAVAVWACIVVLGLAFLLLPEQPKAPLVPRDGWTASGGFVQNARPQPGEVSNSILADPEATFWRSWSADKGSQPGLLMSRPFTAPRVLAVPFAGYPFHPGIDLYLECLATSQRQPIARGNAHENWVERTLWLPASWCPSQVRLGASSTSHGYYIAVGTPVQSSRLSWLKESLFVVTAVHALAWTVLLAPGLAAVWLFRVRRPDVALLAVLPTTLVLGYVTFFATYYGGRAGKFAALLAMLAAGLTLMTRWRALWTQYRDEPIARAIGLTFAISLAYILLVYSSDLGIGSWSATYRFAPAIWSSDSQLPQIVAEGAYRRLPMKNLIGGGWHVSDRPPLLAGLMLLGRPVWEPLIATGDNQRLAFLLYQSLGMSACSLWVIPSWMLLARLFHSRSHAAVGVGLMATTGFIAFNSVYIWPKMLGGALALGAHLALTKATTTDEPRAAWLSYVLAGGLAGLALLGHGGVAFGLVPIFAYPLLRPTRGRVSGVLLAGATAVIVLAPWMVWQRTEDPPGNALIKFALAGTWGMGEESKGVWATVVDAHATMTFADWLRMRRDSLLTLLGVHLPPIISWYAAQPMDLAGRLRTWEFLYLLPALGAGNLGWLAVVSRISNPASGDDSVRSVIRLWLALGLSGVVVASLVNFKVNINHCLSYPSVLLLLLGLYAAVLNGPTWLRRTAIVANVSYFAVVWVWSPLAAFAVRPDIIPGALLAAVGVAVWLIREASQASPGSTTAAERTDLVDRTDPRSTSAGRRPSALERDASSQ